MNIKSGRSQGFDIYLNRMSKICIPIRAKDIKAMTGMIRSTEDMADVFEVWVDPIPAEEWAGIPALTSRPMIIVNKGRKEKGAFRGSEKRRIEVLERFASMGVAFVDVACTTSPRYLKKLKESANRKTRLIFSFHDFRKTPTLRRLRRLRDKAFRDGAHVFKAAVTARNYDDNLTILQFLSESRRAGKEVIAHCMGEKGRISRALAPAFGSYIIYAASDAKNKTAPGQLTLEEFNRINELLKL